MLLSKVFGLPRTPNASLRVSVVKASVSPLPESATALAKKNGSDAARPVLVSLLPTVSLPLTVTSSQVFLMVPSGQINSIRSDPPVPAPGRTSTVGVPTPTGVVQVLGVLLLPS